MKDRNGLVAFALLGLAVGTAAYYLLGTEDGKKTLNKANDGIKDLTRSLKDLSKKEAKRASRLAQEAKEDLCEWKSKAQDVGKDVLSKVSEKASDWAHKASETANRMAHKTEEITEKAKSDISKV